MNKYGGQDFDVDALVRDATSATLPEHTEARLRTQLDDFRNRMVRRGECSRFARWFKDLPRWAAAVAATPILALAAIWIVCSVSSHAAFAQVLEQFKSVRTIRFLMAPNGVPAAAIPVSVLEPGKVREQLPDGMAVVIDVATGKGIFLDSSHKSAVLFDRGASEKFKGGDYLERLRQTEAGSEEKLGKREMGGHTVAGFRLSREGLTYALWADTKTELPVRVEISGAALGAGSTLVLSDFIYNDPMDASLFSLAPPEGYSVQQSQMTPASAAPSENDVLGALRESANLFGGAFLAQLNLQGLGMQLQRKYGDNINVTADIIQAGSNIARACAFVESLKPENDWHYAGAGVKLGEMDVPVCWWKPAGASSYRVVYGDLSVRDKATAPPAPLPEKPMTISTPEGTVSLKLSTALFSNWMQENPGKIDATGLSLNMLFAMAYGLNARDVVINAHLPDRTYDVTVRVPSGRDEATRTLLKTALETHFKYVARYETREGAGYTITCPAGTGPGLHKSRFSKDVMWGEDRGKITVEGYDIKTIVGNFCGALDGPAFDKTGLAGRYDFALTWQPGKKESFIAALRDQLGLEVKEGSVPVKKLIIDPPAK